MTAPTRAPVPDDLAKRAQNLKASAYFLDVTLAGACRIEAGDWLASDHPTHTHAFAFLVEFGREHGFLHRGQFGIAAFFERDGKRRLKSLYICHSMSFGCCCDRRAEGP